MPFAPSRRILGPALALALTTLTLVPSSALAFSKAVWGDVTRNGINQFPLYHRLGVSVFELQLHWDQVAARRPAHPTDPADSAYTWPAQVDQAIAQAKRYRMRVLLQVVSSPTWSNGGHTDFGWAPRNPADFAAFAAAAARRYRSVHLWMIWSEPVRSGNFKPFVQAIPGAKLTAAQKAAPRLYARLLDGAYGALKQINRHDLVIGGCTYTTGTLDPLQWISSLRLPNGKPPRMDMYAHNPFSYSEPKLSAAASPFDEVQFSDLPRLAGWVDRYLHKGLPLFLSEFTIPTAPDNEFNFYVDPKVAARWVADALRLSRRWHRIYALGWVHVYDDPPLSYGGLMSATGRPKPSFYAFQRG